MISELRFRSLRLLVTRYTCVYILYVFTGDKFMDQEQSDGALIPKIPWDQKLVDCCLGSLCEEKLFFFNFFFWTTYFTSFPWTPSTFNSDSIWARGDFLLKMGIKLIFPVFSEELLHAAMWLKLPKGWRVGC
jgi:hypothetical protein